MGLRLQEADTQVKLAGDVEVLVLLEQRADKGGIMGANLGDVGVSTGAVDRVAVACYCRGRWCRRGQYIRDDRW